MRIASTLVVAGLAVAGTVGNAAERDFSRTVPAEADGIVEISNISGTIVIKGWDRPEVDVRATLEGSVERVDVNNNGGRTTIKVVYPSMSVRSGEADLRVSVPKGSEVSVTAVSADVTTSGLLGEQGLKSVSGEVHAEVTEGDFEAKTVSGDIRLRGNSKQADVRLQTVSGNISFERGAGEVDATSVSGDLGLELSPAHSIRMRTTSGELAFRGSLAPSATLDAETISGDARLNASSEAGYAYEASSFSGDLENCFGQSSESTSRHGPGSRLAGTTGGGKGRVRVKSMSGDVLICDH